MASTRLSNKMLIEIGGKSVLQHVIDRAKETRTLLGSSNIPIVLCTTLHREDDQLAKLARNNGIYTHRGSTEDKIERWLGALLEFNISEVAPMDGEDIFADPFLISSALNQLSHSSLLSLVEPDPKMPVGSFLYCFKRELLRYIYETKTTGKTEMVGEYFKNLPAEFQKATLEAPLAAQRPIRLTMDYQEDVDFLRELFLEFKKRGVKRPDLWDVLLLLEAKPELVKINEFRAKDWEENQDRIAKTEFHGT
jgi:spore coat polysaccharide biosynthesis protein SpsF